MLRTAPNLSNIRNRVPAHISRHQTFDIVAGFVGKDKQNSPPEKHLCCGEALRVDYRVHQSPAVMIFTELQNSTALGNRLTGPPHKKPAAGEVSFVYHNLPMPLEGSQCCWQMLLCSAVLLQSCTILISRLSYGNESEKKGCLPIA